MSQKTCGHLEKIPARCHRRHAVTLKFSNVCASKMSQKTCGHPDNFQRARQQDVTKDMRSPRQCSSRGPARCHRRHAVTLIISNARANKMSQKTCGHPEKNPKRVSARCHRGMRPPGNFLCEGTGRGEMPQVECDQPVAQSN